MKKYSFLLLKLIGLSLLFLSFGCGKSLQEENPNEELDRMVIQEQNQASSDVATSK